MICDDVSTERELREAIGSQRKIRLVGDPVIELSAPLNIESVEHLRLVGPGTLARQPVVIEKSDAVCLEDIRFRLGDGAGPSDCATVIDGTRVLFSRCSFAWSVDELVSTYGNCYRCAIVDSLLGYPLHNSVHPKGKHGVGPILAGRDNAFLRNFIAHCAFRPVVVGSAQIIGNVFYNYSQFPIIVEPGSVADVIGNTYATGPSSPRLWTCYVKPGGKACRRENVVSVSEEPKGDGPYWGPSARGLVTRVGVVPRDGVDKQLVSDWQRRTGEHIDRPSDMGGWDLVTEK